MSAVVEVLPSSVFFLPRRVDAEETSRRRLEGLPVVPVLVADEAVRYQGFRSDFGPHSLLHSLEFVACLDALASKHGKVLVVCDGGRGGDAANAVTLLAIYRLLKVGGGAEDALRPFQTLLRDLPPFVDAGFPPFTFQLTVKDVVMGLDKGLRLNLLGDLEKDVNLGEALAHADPAAGDSSWIFPGKFIALASPNIYRNVNPPEVYLDRFVKNKVKVLVRLSEPMYDEGVFERHGIRVVPMYYDDGTTPTDAILDAFLDLSETHVSRGEAVAVHCRAGLGRTGTLIGAYAMRKWGFTAREIIGLLRLQRPGSVIAQQQHYLEALEGKLLQGKLGSAPAAAVPSRVGGPAGEELLSRDSRQGFDLTRSNNAHMLAHLRRSQASMMARAVRLVPWRWGGRL